MHREHRKSPHNPHNPAAPQVPQPGGPAAWRPHLCVRGETLVEGSPAQRVRQVPPACVRCAVTGSC